ncbi:arylsulfatase [Rubellicoccus peritrichatus]|uniref:Arylsulfatase n=1 Tax=Rubellicoccus peritrichatus TaxID=3080537 RepID=A0AAQ3QX83_9BACT|nr:arylsulfatase [Puniceicoccus sp. CR14]WOO43413.1 arylsulfatase [Puniceicoccus sp. CR14]
MKSLLVIIGIVFFTFVNLYAKNQPNIVILLADDLGWADVGFHNSIIRTPHMDSLARQGVILDNFYVQPTCTPTRIALMTGRYPFRTGGHICVLRAHHKHGLPLDERLLSEEMQDAGYTTAITGKWHLGLARRAYWPKSRGFDIQYGHLGGAIDYFTHEGYGTLDWVDNDDVSIHEEGYATDLIGTKASEIILEHDFTKKPLFLYVPFNAPHSPIQAKPEDIKAYSNIENKRRRTYAAMVTSMDEQIGNIAKALKEKGVFDNTLIFFSSDNGGHTDGASNKPLRRHKGTLYEGGVRVPAFIVWPDELKAGQTFDEPLHIVDLFPTLVDLAGGNTDKGKPLDGIDFWPALAKEDSLPKRDILHNVMDASGRGSIRSGDWKLIVSRATDKRTKDAVPLGNPKLVAELFNIKKDPYEQTNLAAEHPEIVNELWAKLKSYGPEIGDAGPYCQKAPEGWKAPADWSQIPQ